MLRIIFSIVCVFFLTHTYANTSRTQMMNDSGLINKTKLIIEFCNKLDSVELRKYLSIKIINNKPANNDDFLKMVSEFTKLGKSNKIFYPTFFEGANKYCYQNVSKTFVLFVGKETHIFEFNKLGKLIGIYFCVRNQ